MSTIIYGVFGDTPRSDKDNIESLWIDKSKADARKIEMEENDKWSSYHIEKLVIEDLDLEKTATSHKKTSKEWIDELSEAFDVSRSVAKEMLHILMSIKTRDTKVKEALQEEKDDDMGR